MSPLRHDYKPSTDNPIRKKRVLPWFAAGIATPIATIVLILSQKTPLDPVTMHDEEIASIESTPAYVVDPGTFEQAQQNHEGAAASIVDIDSGGNLVTVQSPDESLPSPEFHPFVMTPPEFDRLQLTIKRGDTLDRIFRRNDLNLGDLARIVKLEEAAPHLKKLIPGDELTIEHDEGRLVSLYREIDLTNAIRISKEESVFSATMVERPLEVRRKAAYGRIQSSLFESAMQAGLPDKTVMNLAGIFAWDVDFVLDIRTGDDYYLLVEDLYQDGRHVGEGEIVAAEFNNNGRTIQAIRFVDKNGKSDYFTPDGRSVRKAFVRAPVDFTRISSNFNPNRRHPILNRIRAHRGVDYAAPRGTPIKAAGDGKVIFRGVKSGYGNAVILQHGGNITTLYAHMSAFDKNAGINRRVVQGQTIGYVGKTGLATANHLHYEYRLNGVHRNPRTVKLPQAEPISDEYKDEFLASVEPILEELLKYKRTQVASLLTD